MIETQIKENCFEWQYGNSLYLTPSKNRRKIENILMEHRIDYEEGQKLFLTCEICKPIIPYLTFKNKTIGFSEKLYLFSQYNIEIESSKLIDNAYAKLEQIGMKCIKIRDLRQLRQAELKLPNIFEIELMACNECKINENNGIIQNKLKIELKRYSSFLEIETEMIIANKKTVIYYAPAKY